MTEWEEKAKISLQCTGGTMDSMKSDMSELDFHVFNT